MFSDLRPVLAYFGAYAAYAGAAFGASTGFVVAV
jgi:hypothetical protein